MARFSQSKNMFNHCYEQIAHRQNSMPFQARTSTSGKSRKLADRRYQGFQVQWWLGALGSKRYPTRSVATPRATDCSHAIVFIWEDSLSQNNRSMQKAVFRPAGQYYNLAGTVMATDVLVQADRCMGCFAVLLDGRPPLRIGVHGDPCSTTAKL